jgi:hypothetical protein
MARRTPVNRLVSTALAAVALSLVAGVAFAQAVKPHGDEIYTPQPGQTGKDVMWLGTPEAMVTAMLRAARTGPDDFVADLGAGDGRIAIAAAKEFGARSMGIEYEPKMAALAQRNAERAGVAGRVTIVHGDIFKEDFSRASVVTLYLLPELNLQLRPQILAMKPGTRVVSYTFTMGEWEPDETIKGATFDAYRWDRARERRRPLDAARRARPDDGHGRPRPALPEGRRDDYPRQRRAADPRRVRGRQRARVLVRRARRRVSRDAPPCRRRAGRRLVALRRERYTVSARRG